MGMSSDMVEYYRQRAIYERAMAETASLKNVAAIHQELARNYEALVEHEVLRGTLDLRSLWIGWQPARKRVTVYKEDGSGCESTVKAAAGSSAKPA
jgi:hypothetical protein